MCTVIHVGLSILLNYFKICSPDIIESRQVPILKKNFQNVIDISIGSQFFTIQTLAGQMNPNLPSKCMLDNGIFTINTIGENVMGKENSLVR